ncbi:MAG: ABC transporter permease [Atribacterota bacterium]|jgi:sodium transport system permease protein|nr:ABC transporter permease [Atribacterota bacterium]
MNWNNIRLVYFKEILGAIRDRRTLISMIIIPLVFYPLLFFGIGYFTMTGQQKTESLPSIIAVHGEESAPGLIEILKEEEKIQLTGMPVNNQEGLESGEIYLLIEIPDDFNINKNLNVNQSIIIQYDSTSQYSQTARRRIINVLEKYRQQIVQMRLEEVDLSIDYILPFNEEWMDVSSAERKTGSVLGMLLPYIIVILIFVGAMHSAVDITAGEKERGTLATLLVSQLSRLEIVLGKYLTVITLSFTSMLLGLIGLSIAFLTPAYAFGELSLIKINLSLYSFFLFFLVLAPLVGLASSILLLVGIFARNNKEASTYVTPIYMGAIFLGMISLSQGTELSEVMFFIPILNNSVAFKELLMGVVDWGHILSTLFSNIVIALIALLFAARLFSRENVLFRS